MKRQTEFFKKREVYYERRSWGRSSSDRQVHWWRDETVGRHTEPLHQRESSVLVAPAPGTAIKNRLIPMNKHPAMNDDSTVVMDSAVPSVERNLASLLRAVDSSLKDSHLILPICGQKYLKFFKDSPDLQTFKLIIGRSISRTESCEKIDVGDFIIKMIDSDIIYREFYKRNPSLEYLSYRIQNIMNYKVFKPKDLKDYHNETFNELFNDLDEDKQDSIKANKQLAFLCFRKKDGSLDKSRIIVLELKSLPEGEHTEDKIFELLLDIYNESHCDYSEIYIFSTNSPCLARKGCVPCMIRAFVIANMLNEKHGTKTITGFIKNYGLNGSYDNNVPFYPIKDCIYTFDSQTFGSKDLISASSHPRKKQKQHTKVDTKCLIPVYTQIIAEEQNSKFSMKVTVSTPRFNLKKSFPEISNSEIYKQLNEIKQNLFKDPKLDKKSFDDFHACGLEMFEKYTKEIHDLLIDYDENIYEEIRKHLQTRFFPWWAKNLEEASSKYLNEKLSHWLQNYALHLFMLEIEEMQKKIGNCFEIGLVTFN